MRIDQFLKLSRLIKRRTVAKEMADQGRVSINGKTAKAASEVAAGDRVTVRFGQKVLTIEILDIRENLRKEEAASLYRVVEEKRIEAREDL